MVFPASIGIHGPLLRAHARDRAWVASAALGAVGAAIYFASESAAVDAGVLLALGVAGASGILVALRLQRRPNLVPWAWMAAALVLWGVAAMIPWQHSILASGAPPAPGSVADALFIAGYVVLGIGLASCIRAVDPGGGSVIEAVMLWLALALPLWVFVVEPYLDRADLGLRGELAQGGYALGDAFILALAARLLVASVSRKPAVLLVAAGSAALVASDSAWNWALLVGGYTPGTWVDLGWIAFLVLLPVAALHPSSPGTFARRPPRRPELNLPYLALLGSSVLSAPLVVSLGQHGVEAAGVAAVLTLLVVARLALAIRQANALAAHVAEQNERLRELDRLKDDFVASVSHELRTPLTSIRGYLELVRDGETGPLNDEQERFLTVVDRNADRLLHLVSDLLFVAQAQVGKVTLERAPTDVAALAAYAVEAVRPLAEAKGLRLELDAAPVPVIAADPARIEQLLDNLLSNAIKFTPPSGSVGVSACASGRRVVLEVRDTGPGIAAADQDRLFERFFRTGDATRDAVQGTGLGLWISKAIVDAHGGALSLQSVAGAGSVFRAELPVGVGEQVG